MQWCYSLVVLFTLTSLVSGQIAQPHLTTDKSVDCSSIESIVADVCDDSMSKEEKSIALFDFARRLMFHYPNRVDRQADHDTLHLLNTYGYSLCSQQALLTVHLWQTAGIDAGVWAMPGHSTMQATYDGQDHWFDLLIGAYAFKRDGKTIASLQEIAADRTVLTKAVDENRGSLSFIPCGTVLRDDALRFCKHNPKYGEECSQYADDVDYIATLASKGAKWRWGDPGPSRYKPLSMLRRGERIVYLWDYIPGQANCNVLEQGAELREYWVTQDDLPPHHFCGAAAEQRDVVNAEYWKPYIKSVQGVMTGRYAANGRHIYQADLSQEPSEGDFLTNTFQWSTPRESGPVLRVAQAGKPSTLVCPLATPHIYTGAKATVVFSRATDKDVSKIYLVAQTWDHHEGKNIGNRVKVWDAIDSGELAGEVKAVVDLSSIIRNHRDAWLEIVCSTDGRIEDAGIRSLEFEGIFQHNMFARPYLVGGENLVSVAVNNPPVLKEIPLCITYQWEEGDSTKTHEQQVTRSPMTYTINVSGQEIPRMVRLEMSAGK